MDQIWCPYNHPTVQLKGNDESYVKTFYKLYDPVWSLLYAWKEVSEGKRKNVYPWSIRGSEEKK